MQPIIRQAVLEDAETIHGILLEAATWLVQRGIPMWREEELGSDGVCGAIAEGLFFLATMDGEPAGILKFQLSDSLFWPDMPADGAYVHRLAIRRQFAGSGLSSAMLRWAVEQAAQSGRQFLRLDCEANRPKLRAVYERFGFRRHSDRQVSPLFVARYEYRVRNA